MPVLDADVSHRDPLFFRRNWKADHVGLQISKCQWTGTLPVVVLYHQLEHNESTFNDRDIRIVCGNFGGSLTLPE